ncbi:MAG: outer membrane beta-barrel protein [Acidobacteria bacterium]|nr:outer membrane beta-barrel protein [Acidobacteriota bacterium]MDA1236956.1 outer membrane beta-barrel protein [Acidobacteriota bacterium]
MFQFRFSRGVLWSALFLTAVTGANAQTSSAQTPPESKRLSVGAIVGYPITGSSQEVSSSVNTSETTPPTVTDTLVESKGAPFTGGAAIRYDFSERFGAGADILHRRGGYNSTVIISEQITDGNSTADLLLSTFEETRAHLLDIPILGRYYFKDRSQGGGVRPYVTGGLALRFATGASSLSEIADQDQVTDTDLTTIGPANDSTLGGVLGFGLRAADDVGLKVDVEFRYTRWADPIFQSGPANSNNNQVDILVAFTF